MTTIFTGFFDCDPVPKGRARISTRGKKIRTYTPAKTRNFENEIKYWLNSQNKPVVASDCALAVTVCFWLKRPKSVRRALPTVKPDLDNFCKLVLDASNKLLWNDDAQIVDLKLSKRYSSERCGFWVNVETV